MQPLVYTRAQALLAILAQRIAILDGAMGTMIQRFHLNEAQYRGDGVRAPFPSQYARFKDYPRDVKGQQRVAQPDPPDVIADIPRATQLPALI